ncbi:MULTISPECIES: sugar phosphate isomerase/epimerase family protein [Leeuwenhoekiella]|jgi:sugar phosphate isomerase/epimerase|uniref:sugar phosphate isomerase/epimerase family protein n=1 Tax=Leeuwenhoekiella TaxID=283735 RepID=UPI000C6A3A05|nr:MULTISPECIES: sugar phosphate isomerase/epimerase [Leeuwenhoekiella]MAO44009.1 AP endonuclease [Leeuwenhoekiella sp.]MBQ51826.1 AP endonuclease [Leeuwenhoekiella sp.]HBT10040.1 AP endonuclease [Leeuwenhoekiella sp.]HCW63352.1 AP endonuclease [Leeuwenhoekiella sp.]|tara:strand:- start:5165 stop:6217 length:1053 start_codon:yes stop_codon:yes gene_type:complete
MKTIKGPAVFLAQFMDDNEPFNSLDGLCKWASDLGYKGIQIPTWEGRLIDLKKAAESKTYCDELKGKVQSYGLEITELCTHLQGQLVAVHPAYDEMFDNFAPDGYKNNPKKRQAWAVDQLMSAAKASRNLGIDVHGTFSGALLWHTFHPWPQRPPGLVEMGFKELANRWLPILNAFDEQGVDVCYEVHPGEDIHDGVTFERFLEATGNHKRVNILYDPSHFVLQQLDYLQYIDFYHEHIKMFHVKDSEFNATGKKGAFGGYGDWRDRAGRYRSLGDGQIDFKTIFTKLTEYNCDVWAVMEWECCIKSPEQGAREGAPFIASHIIEATEKAFDDFAGAQTDEAKLKRILGL